MELASGLTLLDIEIVPPGPMFFVFLMTWLSSRSVPCTEELLPLGCQMIAAAPKVTLPYPQIQCQRVRIFSPGLKIGSVGLPKGEVQLCVVQKERGMCPCVLTKWAATTASGSKEKIPGMCSAVEQEQAWRQPQVKLPDPLVPGLPFPIGSFPFPLWSEQGISVWIQPLVNTVDRFPTFWDVSPLDDP